MQFAFQRIAVTVAFIMLAPLVVLALRSSFGWRSLLIRQGQHPFPNRLFRIPQQTKRWSSSSVASDDRHKKEAERIRELFIDSYYRNPEIPVPPSTIEKAAEYQSSSNDGGIFPGRHAYLGGAKDDRDGCIYGIPSHARSVVCLYPSDDGSYKVKTVPLPASVAGGNFKWLRGILCDGYLYGIPACTKNVLQVDIDAIWGRRRRQKSDAVRLLPLPDTHQPGGTWQWHGGALNKESNAIYCIPSNAQQVLKVDLVTFTTSFLEIDVPEHYTDFRLDLTNKWYGGILGCDNAVYGVPYRTGSVLRIDCDTDKATLAGPDYGSNKWNWHGGILGKDGAIYAFPSHADTVLKIDTTVCSSTRGQQYTLLPIHRTPGDDVKQYKWLGGATGHDHNIYGMPCDASSILKINVDTGHCSTFGKTGDNKCKWQGAVLARDGCVYAIPSYGRHVLRIDTTTIENAFQLLGNLPEGKSKWQGGFVGEGGSIYCVPENGYRILRVTPSASLHSVDENDLSNVKVDML